MTGRGCSSNKGCCRGAPKEKEPSSVDECKTIRPPADLDQTTLPLSKSITTRALNSIDVRATQDTCASALQPHESISSESSSENILVVPSETSSSRTFLNYCDLPLQPESSCSSSTRHPMLCCGGRSDHDREGTGNVEQHSGSGPSHTSSHEHSSSTCHSKTAALVERELTEPDAKMEEPGESELGPPHYERTILTIEGLKCGCCENGISRAIGQISAIKNHQVNVVLARVEFDLDTDRRSVAEVIKKLNAATGYTFVEYVQPEGQILELLTIDPSEVYNAGRPFGVNLIDSGPKQFWSPFSMRSGRSSVLPATNSTVSLPDARSPTGLKTQVTPRGYRLKNREDLGTDGTAKPHDEKAPGVAFYQHTVRIHYDATLIGPRQVLDYYRGLGSDNNIQLAPPASHPSLAVGARQTRRACAIFLLTATFTAPVLVFAYAPVDHGKLIYAHLSLALASIVQIIAIWEFVPGALRSLIHSRLFEIDFLIALSTTAAFVYSVVSYVFQLHKRSLETGSFFETSTLLVTLILLGRVISELARLRAAKSVSFRSLQAEEALLVLPGGSPSDPKTQKLDTRLLQYGDCFKVPPHTRIVTDGKIIYGGSEVDESMITGESMPVAKGLDHMVHAGTNNGSGTLIVILTALPHENSVSRIAAMVEDAELTKPKVQALADRIAGWFVPAMAAIGTVVFLIWLFVDKYHNHRNWGKAAVKAMTYAIATLIVSCPCAIGLAVPMVVLIAGGVAARNGIIFRDPQKLEVARNVTDVVFDKTGTLTCGLLTVAKVDFHGTAPALTKSLLLGLLKDVKHPVSAAVFDWLKKEQMKEKTDPFWPKQVVGITSIPGDGVVGKCKDSNVEIRAGNPEWLGLKVLESEHTILCVTVADVISATFRLKDRIRSTAKLTVNHLQDRGITVHMLSGDNSGAVKDIAHSLNIAKTDTRSHFKPAHKQSYLQDLQNSGKTVMFIGDGTNDSVALKQADVGVHVNHGSDVAKSASDVVLMTERLHDILILLDISKAAYRRIVMNFAWSALYNLVAILLAAGAFVKARIPPEYAGLGELVSVVPVVVIAFQMRWRRYGKGYREHELDKMGSDEADGAREEEVKLRRKVEKVKKMEEMEKLRS